MMLCVCFLGGKTKTNSHGGSWSRYGQEGPELYVKAKCVGTKQSMKTKVVDGNGGKPEWKEELQFTLNPAKVRKMADRIIEFKVMRKAPVMDDCIGSFEVALDGL